MMFSELMCDLISKGCRISFRRMVIGGEQYVEIVISYLFDHVQTLIPISDLKNTIEGTDPFLCANLKSMIKELESYVNEHKTI